MNKIQVLDHGFVALRNVAGPTRRTHDPEDEFNIDTSGGRTRVVALEDLREFDADDIDPANAARISFDNLDARRTREEDLKLCGYLMKNWHTSPFEMIEIWIEMKMPIFVARQFVRHRTVSINEVSGRYVSLPAEWYIPRFEDVLLQSKDKKQGGRVPDYTNPHDVATVHAYRDALQADCVTSYQFYQEAIERGIAMEQARCHLHLNHYTHWIWKQDLHNIMHFLSLREHGHAQGETQQYARTIINLLRMVLPESMRLYDLYRKRDRMENLKTLLKHALEQEQAKEIHARVAEALALLK